jgi:hypothetical protein
MHFFLFLKCLLLSFFLSFRPVGYHKDEASIRDSNLCVRYVCSHLQFISQRLRERKRNTYVVPHQIQIRNTFNTNGIIDYIVFCKVLGFAHVSLENNAVKSAFV